jgi:hypothetical protein
MKQEFAAAHASARSDEDDDEIVQSLLQQIYLCRQAAAEQAIRLRALVAELEQSAAVAAATGLSMSGLAGRDDAAALNDLYYARALQESELREELAYLRRRGVDLSGSLVGNYGAASLPGDAAQRHRQADLFRQRQDEEAALRQYQQLIMLESQARFAPFAQGPMVDRSSDMHRSLLPLGLDHRRGDTTSLDHMLRGTYNDPLSGTSLMTPATRHDSQVAQSRDNLPLYSEHTAQPSSVDHDYKEEEDDKTADSAVDDGANRGRMKRGDSADSSS